MSRCNSALRPVKSATRAGRKSLRPPPGPVETSGARSHRRAASSRPSPETSASTVRGCGWRLLPRSMSLIPRTLTPDRSASASSVMPAASRSVRSRVASSEPLTTPLPISSSVVGALAQSRVVRSGPSASWIRGSRSGNSEGAGALPVLHSATADASSVERFP
jgi:hypothetical protein